MLNDLILRNIILAIWMSSYRSVLSLQNNLIALACSFNSVTHCGKMNFGTKLDGLPYDISLTNKLHPAMSSCGHRCENVL
jgi:hypothetical protein